MERYSSSHTSVWLTPNERMARFAELQRRAMHLLVASPNGYRHFWERNLRQRSTNAKY